MNDVSAINNSTQPDTSLNLTHAELVAKLQPYSKDKNSDETESVNNINLENFDM